MSEDQGIRTIIGGPARRFTILARTGFGEEKFDSLEKTDWFFDRCLMLPMHMALSDEDVDTIIDAIQHLTAMTLSGDVTPLWFTD